MSWVATGTRVCVEGRAREFDLDRTRGFCLFRENCSSRSRRFSLGPLRVLSLAISAVSLSICTCNSLLFAAQHSRICPSAALDFEFIASTILSANVAMSSRDVLACVARIPRRLCGNLEVHIVLRVSSENAVLERVLNRRKNCDGVESPMFSRSNNCRVLASCDAHKRFFNADTIALYGFSAGLFIITSRTSRAMSGVR